MTTREQVLAILADTTSRSGNLVDDLTSYVEKCRGYAYLDGWRDAKQNTARGVVAEVMADARADLNGAIK